MIFHLHWQVFIILSIILRNHFIFCWYLVLLLRLLMYILCHYFLAHYLTNKKKFYRNNCNVDVDLETLWHSHSVMIVK